jgi:hypothetical protein
MEIHVALIGAYEHMHLPAGPTDPVDAIRFRLEHGIHMDGARLPALNCNFCYQFNSCLRTFHGA